MRESFGILMLGGEGEAELELGREVGGKGLCGGGEGGDGVGIPTECDECGALVELCAGEAGLELLRAAEVWKRFLKLRGAGQNGAERILELRGCGSAGEARAERRNGGRGIVCGRERGCVGQGLVFGELEIRSDGVEQVNGLGEAPLGDPCAREIEGDRGVCRGHGVGLIQLVRGGVDLSEAQPDGAESGVGGGDTGGKADGFLEVPLGGGEVAGVCRGGTGDHCGPGGVGLGTLREAADRGHKRQDKRGRSTNPNWFRPMHPEPDHKTPARRQDHHPMKCSGSDARLRT